ncbi:MAG: class I SAM-dependent methyltransferase [Myroides sp.]|nr:class I SAM-dependent methyltransferase [Myroides sp.]
MKNKTIKDHSSSQEIFQIIYNKELQCYQTIPVPENIGSYYASENYISHTDSRHSFTDKIYQFVKKINLSTKTNLIKKYTNTSPTLLDIGAGTGDFVNYCQQKNWNAYGIEPNPKARQLAQNKGCKIVSDYAELPKQQYDVITLWHVLEHIPNPENELEKIKSLLKPEGIIIIAVPNFRSWDARHYREFWAAWDIPRHLWHFSKSSISYFAKKINCKIETIKPMWFDAFYVSLLSEKYKYGKSRMVSAFINGIRSNCYGMLKNEFSSHIFVLKNNKN